ncbi:Uncharacterised protein [Acinetobacter baumannii]|nr:Uncharacterised protein [Acinetobacter baumannii]
MKKFKEHAWKKYQKQHPEKAKQYQTLYQSYKIVKKCVDEIKAEQQMKIRQEQQLKAQQHAPKMKFSWHESLKPERVSTSELRKFAHPFPWITSSLSINHLHTRASRMGANFPSLIPKSSVARKKSS